MIITTFGIDGRAGKRYVRRTRSGAYVWCIQNADCPRYDLAQGYADAEDLPMHIKDACDSYQGAFYACEWPYA